jgi:hypothetical protein
VRWWPGDGNAQDMMGPHEGTLQGGTTFAPGPELWLWRVCDGLEIPKYSHESYAAALVVRNLISSGATRADLARPDGKPFENHAALLQYLREHPEEKARIDP